MQVIVALSGEATTYSADPSKAAPEPPALPVGGGAALVSLVQVRGHMTRDVFVQQQQLSTIYCSMQQPAAENSRAVSLLYISKAVASVSGIVLRGAML